MKMHLFLAASALIAAPAQAEMFNGGYVGLQTGWEQNKVDSTTLFKDAGLGTVTTDKTTVSGATIGLNIGYDAKIGSSFVVGGEFAGSISTSKNKQKVTFVKGLNTTVLGIDYKSDATFEVTARAGILASSQALIYVRGGYVNSKLSSDITSGTLAEKVSGNNNGFMAGGGFQYAISDKIGLRAEYRYFDFKGPVTRNQAVLGLAYSF